jgi:3'-phosphoadenosine 5'-phosphosulfate sulfotransferase (PAPS reductase)/FAD synthetase
MVFMNARRCAPSINPNIVAFSFGQTSALMLRRLMDEHGKDFDKKFSVIYENTGKENDATLDFGHEIETRWGVPITWLEYCRVNNEHAWRIVDYKTAARRFDKRTPFDELLDWCATLPNVRQRRCSGQLKERTKKRFLQSIGFEWWTDYIGIRYDESDRATEIRAAVPKYIRVEFPLIDAKITKKIVDDYWNAQPFRLNIPNYQGNCDLCFLKAKWKRLAIMEQEPEAAKWWIDQEKRFAVKPGVTTGAHWIDGVTYEGLLAEAQHPQLNFNEPDIACSCIVGGYRETDDEGHNFR